MQWVKRSIKSTDRDKVSSYSHIEDGVALGDAGCGRGGLGVLGNVHLYAGV
jgi:hypothetical protein